MGEKGEMKVFFYSKSERYQNKFSRVIFNDFNPEDFEDSLEKVKKIFLVLAKYLYVCFPTFSKMLVLKMDAFWYFEFTKIELRDGLHWI